MSNIDAFWAWVKKSIGLQNKTPIQNLQIKKFILQNREQQEFFDWATKFAAIYDSI